MNKIKQVMNSPLVFLVAVIMVASLAFTGIDGSEKGRSSNPYKIQGKEGDAYILNINNIWLPVGRDGILADVNVDGTKDGRLNGQDGNTFLFSGGFFLSGMIEGEMFTNAVASASRITDYEPGTVEGGKTDPRAQLYVINSTDGAFADSWEDWRDAVALGAYFYDGDGDGVYNPVDLNNNAKWDSTEDRPDLLGDETVWCVYNDNIDPALRRFNDVGPKGIEIRQSVFGFNAGGIVGNMVFIRYSILNTGLVSDVIDSVYFGVWADPDLGDHMDDLVGCDTTLDAAFVYNDGTDDNWGNNPPCFLIDFFQGPKSYVAGETYNDVNNNGFYDEGIDEVLDSAFHVGGPQRGMEIFPGAKNVGISSFVHYIQSHPSHGDPDNRIEARNYMLGFNKLGEELDPCTWAFGEVRGDAECGDVNPRFSYSGNPVTDQGWINNDPNDQRQMQNTGPFQLIKGEPVDIVVAYIVAQGQTALNSVDLAKEYSEVSQVVFNNNFPTLPPPPTVKYEVKQGADFIDLQWPTYEQLQYRSISDVFNQDRQFEGFYVTQYRVNKTNEEVDGQINKMEVAHYQLIDSIKAIYQVVRNGGQEKVIDEVTDQAFLLDSTLYADPETGRIRVRITQDAFTAEPLIPGHEYYYTITQYHVNMRNIVNRSSGIYDGLGGDYLAPTSSDLFQLETKIIPITFGSDDYNPVILGDNADLSQGVADGKVKFIVVDQNQLTGSDYKVEFFADTENDGFYTPYWKLINTSTGATLIDSSKYYNMDTTSVAGKIVEGFLVKVEPNDPLIGTPEYSSATPWYAPLGGETGVFYAGNDVRDAQGSVTRVGGVTIANLDKRSTYTTADKLKRIELRFGTSGKAYRYLNGYVGSFISKRASLVYAGGVGSDVANYDEIGKKGEGYVDVPFTAWVVDENLGLEYQLAVGFIEAATSVGGNPDGIWDPGTDVGETKEVIVIFDSEYDPNGAQIVYTGDSNGWADLKGYDGSGSDDQKKMAESPYFNALYVVSLQRADENSFYSAGEVLSVPVGQYPYTPDDTFAFETPAQGKLSEVQKQDIFSKVNVFPNPLFAYNPATSYANDNPDEPFVTFSHLPTEVTIKIYSLSGLMVRELTTMDKSSPTSSFLRWDLENQDGLRVASGMYIAIVSSPGYGEKVLKFAVILPQKQIEKY